MLTVLVVLIPTAFVAAALLGLSMCRLAALSDDNQAVAVADWIATTSYLAERKSVATDRESGQLQIHPRGKAFRATG
jgi:hypothetical protein